MSEISEQLHFLGKVVQSNERFRFSFRLAVHLDHVRMPDGKGREKTKGRSLVVLSTMRRNIVFEKAVFYFLLKH